jgi:hypothetical protein
MKSDTFIGIIGSILLVGIIIGVFVYEYNSVEELTAEELQKQSFARSEYSHLEAEGNIDGDEFLNFEDDDLDGDGVPNASDDELAVIVPFDGTYETGAGGLLGTHQAQAGTGIFSISVEVIVTPTASLVGIPTTEEYVAELTINGDKRGDSGLEYTVPGEQGALVLTISSTGGQLGGEYTGSLTLNYSKSQT